MDKKVALITGITGQDGSYLAEFLIEKGYEVHGLMRRSSSFNTARIEHLYLDEWVRDMKKARLVNLHWADMTDSSSLIRVISKVRPTEIYNLAAHIQQTPMPMVCSVCWKLFASAVLPTLVASIRPLLLNCMVRYKRFLRVRRLPSTPAARMQLLNSMASGL